MSPADQPPADQPPTEALIELCRKVIDVHAEVVMDTPEDRDPHDRAVSTFRAHLAVLAARAQAAPEPPRHEAACAAGITNGAARCQCVNPPADPAPEGGLRREVIRVAAEKYLGDFDTVMNVRSEARDLAVAIDRALAAHPAPGETREA